MPPSLLATALLLQTYDKVSDAEAIFLSEPLAGWRHVAITERRTMEDFANQMRGEG